VSFWALVIFTFVFLVGPQFYLPFLIPLRLALTTAVLAGATYAIHRLSRGEPIVQMTGPTRLLIALVAWTIATIPFSRWPGGSVELFLNEFLKSIIVFWLVSENLGSLKRFRAMTWGLSLFILPLVITGIRQYLAGEFMRGGQMRIKGYEAPLSANPNDLALILCMVLPLSIAALRTTRRRSAQVVLGAIIVVTVMAVVVTFSRAGFIALALVTTMYLLRLAREGKRGLAIMIAVLAVAATPLLPGNYLERLALITDIDSDPTGSAQARRQDTLLGVGVILRNPIIGTGLGMNKITLNDARHFNAWSDIHNVYLQYGVDLGVPGLVLFLALVVACFRGVRRARDVANRTGNVELRGYADGLLTCLSTFAIVAVFYPVAYHFYFYFFGGMAVALARLPESRQPDRGSKRASALHRASERLSGAKFHLTGSGG
jgi:O-antigen ligase